MFRILDSVCIQYALLLYTSFTLMRHFLHSCLLSCRRHDLYLPVTLGLQHCNICNIATLLKMYVCWLSWRQRDSYLPYAGFLLKMYVLLFISCIRQLSPICFAGHLGAGQRRALHPH